MYQILLFYGMKGVLISLLFSVSQDSKAPQKKKKKKELVNLYPWQQRETQRQQIAELRQKFEEDKRRVAEMKARRKFKPF